MVSKILITAAATVVAAGASSITEEVDAPHRRLDSVGADNNRVSIEYTYMMTYIIICT